MALNAQQQLAFELCLSGKNVLITGAGGVGKSYTISRIRSAFHERARSFAVTASTGAAAVLIDGITLHRWAGIGLGKYSAERLAKDILFNSRRADAKRRWQQTTVLIIDEVSMIDADLFDKLEAVARAVRGNESPFGGMQVIVIGDFAQLPPVKAIGGFAFQAKTWRTVIQHVVELTVVVRQSEERFRRALTEVRFGTVSKETATLFRSRVGAEVGNDLIKPTLLLSKRDDVKRMNEEHLAKLPGAEVVFESIDRYEQSREPVDPELREKMNREMQARDMVRLKVGAQVVLICNHSNELVNGSRGIITDFRGGLPVVRFLNNAELVVQRHVWRAKLSDTHTFVRTQVPLMLAYALTIHRSQGCTLDCVEMDISNCFEYGQAYVSLSRVRTLEGLRLRNPDLSRIMVHPLVKGFYASIAK